MAIWKVKSQTVTVELLGRLPQSDGDLQADPPAKTVHGQSAREPSPSLLLTGQYPGIPREHSVHSQVCPFLDPINLASLLESPAQAPSEASREVVTTWALGLGRKPGSWQPETIP